MSRTCMEQNDRVINTATCKGQLYGKTELSDIYSNVTGDKCLSSKRTFLLGWYVIVFHFRSIQT